MARLSTIYDDVGNGVKEKVFVLRGDEAYARSTDTVVTIGDTFDESEIEYFTTDVTVKVLRSLGSAPVYLYKNDDQKLGEWNVSRSFHEFTLEDAKFPYGEDNKLYARFKGNEQCLTSKSKPVVIHRDIPPTFITNIDITTASQISHFSDCNVSVEIMIGDSTTASALHNRDIRILVDGVYVETITTGENDNTASTTISGLNDGIHTITAEVDKASNINYGTASATVMKGYKLAITDYPSKFIDGTTNVVTILLTDYNNTPVPNASITFNDTEYITNTNGVASCNVTTITSGTYYATYEGSQSNSIDVVVSIPSGITITHSEGKKLIGVTGSTIPLLISVGGDDVGAIPVTVNEDSESPKTITTDANGNASYNYICNGSGDVNITASASNLTNTVTIEDCLAYLSIPDNYESSRGIGFMWSTLTKYNSYYQLNKTDKSRNACSMNFKYVLLENYPNLSLEFKLMDNIKAYECRLYIQGSMPQGSDYVVLDISKWQKGAVVKLSLDGNQLKQYVNDKLITTSAVTGKNPNTKYWELFFETSNDRPFTFSELKFKKL